MRLVRANWLASTPRAKALGYSVQPLRGSERLSPQRHKGHEAKTRNYIKTLDLCLCGLCVFCVELVLQCSLRLCGGAGW
jgi:hypothetical protein